LTNSHLLMWLRVVELIESWEALAKAGLVSMELLEEQQDRLQQGWHGMKLYRLFFEWTSWCIWGLLYDWMSNELCCVQSSIFFLYITTYWVFWMFEK
jgi:hypothetical protein